MGHFKKLKQIALGVQLFLSTAKQNNKDLEPLRTERHSLRVIFTIEPDPKNWEYWFAHKTNSFGHQLQQSWTFVRHREFELTWCVVPDYKSYRKCRWVENTLTQSQINNSRYDFI